MGRGLVFALSFFCALLRGRSIVIESTGWGVEYIYYTEKHTWNEARSICHTIGGELAKIDTQQNIMDIAQLALDTYPEETVLSGDFWIGLYDHSSNRTQWASDCSVLTFNLNYVDPYDGTKHCFKSRGGNNFVGYRRSCADATPFLCEIHGVIENCTFRYPMDEVSFIGVDDVTSNMECQDQCAPDILCDAALFVSPTLCYKKPYNPSTSQPYDEVTMNTKYCASFRKNDTVVTEFSNNNKDPEGACGVIPQNGPPVSNMSIDPSESYRPPCATLVMTELMTQPCDCMTSIVSALATVTQIQMTTVQPPTSPCVVTASPDTITAIHTVMATATVTEVDLVSAIVTQMITATVTDTETTTAVLTQIATTTVMDVEIETVRLSASPCVYTASPETTTAIHTVIATATLTEVEVSTAILTQTTTQILTQVETTTAILTQIATTILTEVEMTTVEVIHQCTPQTYTSPVTVQVTATPSCSLPDISVTSPTTILPYYMNNSEASRIAAEISKNLTVDKKECSMYERTLISVPDHRLTARAIGGVGIACIAVSLLLIAFNDINHVFTCNSVTDGTAYSRNNEKAAP